MNKDRLLFDAKKKVLDLLAAGYKAPEPRTLKVAGPSGRAALDMAVQGLREQGKATPYDLVVSDYLAETLSGGQADPLDEVSEDDILKLERTNFMKLVRHEGTLKRIEHMLLNGKPLRN
jgi:3-hydroxyacyl-CoA dehydrogenase